MAFEIEATRFKAKQSPAGVLLKGSFVPEAEHGTNGLRTWYPAVFIGRFWLRVVRWVRLRLRGGGWKAKAGA
jgi:hypothetical protein